jgi:hypothetical protein
MPINKLEQGLEARVVDIFYKQYNRKKIWRYIDAINRASNMYS